MASKDKAINFYRKDLVDSKGILKNFWLMPAQEFIVQGHYGHKENHNGHHVFLPQGCKGYNCTELSSSAHPHARLTNNL